MKEAVTRCILHVFLPFILITVLGEDLKSLKHCPPSSSNFCGWTPGKGLGSCEWNIYEDVLTLSVRHSHEGYGYAVLTNEFHPSDSISSFGGICVYFDVLFDIDRASQFLVKVVVNVSCTRVFETMSFRKLFVVPENGSSNVTTPTAVSTSSDGGPTDPTDPDIQYVGVVVGAICIALFTLFSCLTIISARRSNQRDSRRREVQSPSGLEEDDRPDVVAENAPPSYDAVMACPDMYPPTPHATPVGTPETTPHLSLHRRALLNQHGSSPQIHRHSLTPTVSEQLEGDNEEPPPPYPGLANGNIENRVPATNHSPTDSNLTGESNPAVIHSGGSTSATRPRSGEHAGDDLSPVNDRESNPWVLNNTGNDSRGSNPRGSYPPSRNSTGANRLSGIERDSPAEFAMQARTAEPELSDISPDEDSQRASVSTTNSADDVIEYNNSRISSGSFPKSNMNDGGSALPRLGIA